MYSYFRSRKKRKLAYLFTFIAIVIIAIILYSIYVLTRFESVLTTEGYVQMKLDKIISTLDRYVIVLKGECTELDLFVSPEQALAIQEGVMNVTKFRPMTHDLIVDILEGFEIKPVMVKITKLVDETYFAELTLKEGNHFLIADTRPSDSIAISVRTNTPIYVNKNLVMKTC
jgi:hypothetical protein